MQPSSGESNVGLGAQREPGADPSEALICTHEAHRVALKSLGKRARETHGRAVECLGCWSKNQMWVSEHAAIGYTRNSMCRDPHTRLQSLSQ